MEHRLIQRLLLTASAWCALASPLWAQESPAGQPPVWPYMPIDPNYFRGPGFYLSVTKILCCWALFLLWVKTADWINQDVQRHHWKVALWNPIVVGTFAVTLLLMFVLPYYWLGIFLLLLAYAGPLGTYVFYYRNPKVEDHDRVLTPAHLRFWFAERLKVVGIKIEAEKPDVKEVGPPLQLIARGGATPADDQANDIAARQLPGFVPARMLLADARGHRAHAVLLDYGDTVAVRYLIDGVWHNHQPQPREAADQAVQVFKKVSGIDPAATAARLQGHFEIDSSGKEIPCNLSIQTSGAAQRVLVRFELPATRFQSLDDLGMLPRMTEAVRELLASERGIVLFSSLPGGGLTTMLDMSLMQVDRFLRDFVSVEDASLPESRVDNVDPKTYDGAAGETPATILPAIGRAQPDAIVCRNLVDGRSIKELSQQATERLIIATIQAKNAVEAPLRVLVMKAPARTFAAAIKAVIHERLIRKLCEDCREAYEPSPDLLKKLGIPAGKVPALYRPPQVTDDGAVCESCGGLGYHGRTGIFEVLHVDDEIRTQLAGKPQLESLRKAARAAGMQTQLEHGIVLVAKGVTSVQELQRVMKG